MYFGSKYCAIFVLIQDWRSCDSVALKDRQSCLAHYCNANLLARHDPMILLLLRLQVADIIIFDFDAHPIYLGRELINHVSSCQTLPAPDRHTVHR